MNFRFNPQLDRLDYVWKALKRFEEVMFSNFKNLEAILYWNKKWQNLKFRNQIFDSFEWLLFFSISKRVSSFIPSINFSSIEIVVKKSFIIRYNIFIMFNRNGSVYTFVHILERITRKLSKIKTNFYSDLNLLATFYKTGRNRWSNNWREEK